jgi:RNA polymerase sigma factor (sigma-70 family)
VRRVLQPPRLESIDEPTGTGRTGTPGGGAEDVAAAAPRTDRAMALHDDRDDPESIVVDQLLREALEQYGLARLDDRERYVIVRRYGLDGRPEDTLADLGVALGVARETVRQIEVRALARLRQPEIAERFAELVGG